VRPSTPGILRNGIPISFSRNPGHCLETQNLCSESVPQTERKNQQQCRSRDSNRLDVLAERQTHRYSVISCGESFPHDRPFDQGQRSLGQRSRVRAPSSPPYIPNDLWSDLAQRNRQNWVQFGCFCTQFAPKNRFCSRSPNRPAPHIYVSDRHWGNKTARPRTSQRLVQRHDRSQ
jgi:hypothetical protein